MGKLLEELKHFLSTSTPEQLEQAWKEVGQFEDVGPTITEYIESMEEIKEAYCSFEVAKLLKEKGFHEPCIATYNSTTKNFQVEEIYEDWTTHWKDYISASTHQMACAWIRKKGYSVEVHVTPVGWHWEVCTVGGKLIASSGACDDYDECMENALIYTLTNLI